MNCSEHWMHEAVAGVFNSIFCVSEMIILQNNDASEVNVEPEP
jgi:hypothetical protein